MENNKKSKILCYLTVLLLLTSGGLKLFGAGELIGGLFMFDLRWIESGMGGWIIAPVAVRVLTSIELITGFLMLFQLLKSNKLFYAFLLLIAIYSADLFLGSNNVLTKDYPLLYLKYPALSWGALFIMILAMFSLKNQKIEIKTWWWSIPVVTVVLGTVFALNPLFVEDYNEEHMPYTYKEKSWTPIKEKFLRQGIDLNEGNYLIAFFSTNCMHCNNLAKVFGASYRGANSSKKVVLVFPGKEDDTKAFIERNCSDFPYIRVSPDEFTKVAGFAFPSLFEMEQGEVKKHWTGTQFNFKVRNQQFFTNAE